MSAQMLKKKVFARGVLATLGRNVVSRSQFMQVCTASEHIPASYQMSSSEAAEFLETLKRAGAVVQVNSNHVYLAPAEVIDAVHLRAGLPRLSRELPKLAADHQRLSSHAAEGVKQNEEKVAAVIAKQKNFWAGAALLSGTQMSILAYLQFQVFGWDVMEPITYFITTGTALVMYVYFLYFRREHSYESVDGILVPELVARDMKGTQKKVLEWLADSHMADEISAAQANVGSKAVDHLEAQRSAQRDD